MTYNKFILFVFLSFFIFFEMASAQDFLGGKSNSNTKQANKQQIYKCGNSWSYYPCPAVIETTTSLSKSVSSKYSEIENIKVDLSKMKLIENIDKLITDLDRRYHVIPNHAYRIKALCKNPEISVMTCARLVEELKESVKSYDKDQELAELERREKRELDEKKRMVLRAERLKALQRHKVEKKNQEKEIEQF
ncbi:MAG: hypothetical protein LBE20_01780 [Deltaproteobacteria bacterium]|jgi:hypothetical protein|nr:hypothetical protein [Deltaproteobacteria bacterium]